MYGVGSIIVSLFWVFVVIVLLVILTSCIRIVRQAQALVIERLGAYQTTWGTGLHFKMPILDRVARKVDLKEQVVDFAPQPVITKDNVTMRIDTVVFFQITDPKLFTYGVENPMMAIRYNAYLSLAYHLGSHMPHEPLPIVIVLQRHQGNM